MSFVKFKGATLLSVKDFMEVPGPERDLGGVWWLKDEGDEQKDGIPAVFAAKGNDLICEDTYFDYYIRPALMIETDLEPGEIFQIADYRFFVMRGQKLALMNTALCRSPFNEDWVDPDASDYEKSDAKKVVDAFYEERIKGRERDIWYENTMNAISVLGKLMDSCETASNEVFVSSMAEQGILDSAVALAEKIENYLNTKVVTKMPEDMPARIKKKDHFFDVPFECECHVNEIINWFHSDYKDKLVQTHHVKAVTRRDMCLKIYAFERSSRYDSARRYEIVEDDFRSLYSDWKECGGVTMEVYYGGGTVD